MNVSVSECLVRIYVDRSDVVCGAVVKPSVPHARLDEITSCQSVIERVALRAQITVVTVGRGQETALLSQLYDRLGGGTQCCSRWRPGDRIIAKPVLLHACISI